MKNDITAVRNLLIQGMEELLNPEPESTFDVNKAKALASLGKVLIESAKAETAAIQSAARQGIDVKGTGFFNLEKNRQLGTGE